MSDARGPGENRFDAVERLRRKLEGTKPSDPTTPDSADRAAKVTRLPRRPRRVTETPAERPRRTWHPDNVSAYDPAPTRPVTRAELQRETGWWQATPEAPTPPSNDAPRQEADVIDFGSLRRKPPAPGDTAPTGFRRIAKPRRITPTTDTPGPGDSDRA
ncbi:hypothetical protein [Nocardia huaxiensis]|uniref:Uncharacterized protein n=1 Tax=Nocardia huaxiensis TaxID=2755382 RepID=A0A7D6ZSA3_9NOCA|nr:hypothetical protein [Nocardia huaxiensis]QLY27569.1 hypothetical protein H0264_18990 [Nocardia huaxiensis]UFT00443.1 hypothetical protein LPY97_14710 [Nocardia huaxiensis]